MCGWALTVLSLIMAIAYVLVIPHRRLLTAVPICVFLGVVFLVMAMYQID